MAQTAGIINGTEFLMHVDNVPISYDSSHTLDVSMATIEASNKASAGWAEKKPGQRSWSASGDGMYSFDAALGFTGLMSLVTNRTLVSVKLATSNELNSIYIGNGYLTSLSLNAPNEDTATYSWTFEGTGALLTYVGT